MAARRTLEWIETFEGLAGILVMKYRSGKWREETEEGERDIDPQE